MEPEKIMALIYKHPKDVHGCRVMKGLSAYMVNKYRQEIWQLWYGTRVVTGEILVPYQKCKCKNRCVEPTHFRVEIRYFHPDQKRRTD